MHDFGAFTGVVEDGFCWVEESGVLLRTLEVTGGLAETGTLNFGGDALFLLTAIAIPLAATSEIKKIAENFAYLGIFNRMII